MAAAVAALALSATQATALSIAGGDLVGVFVKNGVEQVVNLGPLPTGAGSTVMLDLSAELNIPEFGGTVDGAKFVGLAVTDPQRTIDFGLGVVPQENIIFTSNAVSPQPSDSNIAGAMASTDQGATAWFALLRGLGVGSSDLISSAETFSYESKLGLGGDAIANNFLFSTADIISGTLQISVYEAIRGYEGFPGGPPTEIAELGTITIDAGLGVVTLTAVPEPGTALLLTLGLMGLGALGRRNAA